MMERLKLSRIRLEGFKSIRPEGEEIQCGDLTVLLGANGAGKSNVVSFFRLLHAMMERNLQTYIGENGTSESFLYYGLKKTRRFAADIELTTSAATYVYRVCLAHAAGDRLIFAEESVRYQPQGTSSPEIFSFDSGVKESNLLSKSEIREMPPVQSVFDTLKRCRVFQFHDTSKEAKIRNNGYINDNFSLLQDGSNLAALLYAMRENSDGERYYHRLVRHIQRIMPQFGDFELHPSPLNENYIALNWKERGVDYLFGPHQLSDGALRFMAIATLLLQPPAALPSVIILDEPELGLHPSAIAALAGMAKAASTHCQVMLATQSPRLVDEFEPGNIRIVERNIEQRCSEVKALDQQQLADWLERYSLSELWEKNVFGGQP